MEVLRESIVAASELLGIALSDAWRERIAREGAAELRRTFEALRRTPAALITPRGYPPVKLGGRFSMNACTASARSFDCRNALFHTAT